MSKIRVLHNPRCSKSRQTCRLLEDSGKDFEIIEYLKHPPSPSELKTISEQLDLAPTEFIRAKEKTFKELGLSLKDDRSDDDWFALMSANPILIERPIVIRNGQAVLGRPPENIQQIL
ncbi:MAG: arsenate reductase (glutaredoxin) [Verrucomicrobiota bacterium]